MDKLTQMHASTPRAGSPPLTSQEISNLSKQIPDWRIVEQDGEKRLQRTFQFGDFAQALDLTNRVGGLAQQEDHHPAILTEWGKVTVTWWTHKVHGLHLNDFILAAKTDELYQQAHAEEAVPKPS